MAIKEIGAALDRVARNTINDNFKSQDGRIDNLVLQAGDAHPELQDAHYSGVKGQTFATVGKRFDAVEQQAITDKTTANSELQAGLATKRDKSVMLTQADMSTASEAHKITPNHLNQAIKDMMSGSTPVSPNIADGQVTTEKLANGAATVAKIGDKRLVQNNLFDINNSAHIIKDKYINVSGVMADSAGRAVLKIPVSPSELYSYFEPSAIYFGAIAFYKDDTLVSFVYPPNFIGEYNGVKYQHIATPPTCNNVRVSAIQQSPATNFGEGVILSKGYVPLGNSELIGLGNLNIAHTQQPSIEYTKQNIALSADIVSGYLIGTAGLPNSSATSTYSIIKIEPNKTYSIWRDSTSSLGSFGAFSFYYKGVVKQFHYSGLQPSGQFEGKNYYTFTAPAECDALMFTTKVSTFDGEVIVNEGVNIERPLVSKINGVSIGLDSSVLNKKNWCVVGDSWTEANSTATIRYFDYISEELNLNVANRGVGGTGFKRGDDTNAAYYQRVSTIPLDSDVITIWASGNDASGHNATLGTATDTTNETIAGCVNLTLDAIFTRCPNAKVAIMSPGAWVGNETTKPNAFFRAYSNMLREVCDRRGIQFLDLYTKSGLRPDDTAFFSTHYKDNSHINDAGQKYITPLIREFVKKLV